MTLDISMYVVLYREGISEITAIAVCCTRENAEAYLVREGYERTEHPSERFPWYVRDVPYHEPELAIIRRVPYYGNLTDLMSCDTDRSYDA